MAYSDKVVDHYNNPRNVGSFTKDTPGVGTGLVGARTIDVVKRLREMSPLYELAKEGVDLKSIRWKAD